MSKFKVGDTAWIKVVLTENGHDTYPWSGVTFEGCNFGNYTDGGKYHENDKTQTPFTEDEVREMLGVNKAKDEMRYFYVNFYVKDTNGGGEHVSIPITHTRMFSLDGLRKYFASAFNTSLRAVRIISWQELTEEDYEAFTA